MNEFVIKNGFYSYGGGVITGSLTIAGSAGQTVLNTNIDTFDLSGSMLVTGSFNVSGSSNFRGGAIATTDTTFNLLNTTATTVNIAGAGTAVNIGASSGRTTVNHDLAVGTGTIIGAPGGAANVMTLISSGNIIAKLDVNNDATGHRFAVVNNADVDQFRVYETGNAEVAGSFIVSGSSIITPTTTTFNLLNSNLTGTLNFGGAATTISFGSPTSTGSFRGDLVVEDRTTFGGTVERIFHSQSAGGVSSFDLVVQSVFYVNNPTSNITANFTSVPTTNFRVLTPTVILSQSATARIVSNVQIDGAAQTINWATGLTPTGTAGKQDVFGFSLIRSGSAWKVLGQMSTYG
jgi:hypothetical protein